MKKLVIFDLDGTLFDTLADLASSVNHALKLHGMPIHEVEEYKLLVGRGAKNLISQALPKESLTDELLESVLNEFSAHYDSHYMDASVPYVGILDMIEKLKSNGVLIAILSNKPDAFTKKIAEKVFPCVDYATGFVEGMPLKPDKAAVELILKKLNVDRNDCVYVGDSGVDMKTGNAANLFTVGVTWGFRTREELLRDGAHILVDSSQQLLNVLLSRLCISEQTLEDSLGILPGVISFIGGGGKTTLMYALAKELHDRRMSVVMTTTTKIFPPFPDQAEELIAISDWDCILDAKKRGALIVVCGGLVDGKVKALNDTEVLELSKVFSYVLVEADGSRRLPIKVPAEHEPVIPKCSTKVIAVAGISAVGKPISEVCLRYEIAEQILGVDSNHSITPKDVAKMLCSEQGGRKNVGERQFCVILNQTDTAPEVAKEIAALISPSYRVVLSSAHNNRFIRV